MEFCALRARCSKYVQRRRDSQRMAGLDRILLSVSTSTFTNPGVPYLTVRTGFFQQSFHSLLSPAVVWEQLATFHPRYRFEGSEEDDASNYTNRSPFPVLHLLLESQVRPLSVLLWRGPFCDTSCHLSHLRLRCADCYRDHKYEAFISLVRQNWRRFPTSPPSPYLLLD